MSQHIFHTTIGNDPVSVMVLAGWDRPLQGFFMVIQFSDGDRDGQVIFSNMDWEDSHPKEFGKFLKVTEKLGITLPDEMVQEIVADGLCNMGNKHVRHELVGGKCEREERGTS